MIDAEKQEQIKSLRIRGYTPKEIRKKTGYSKSEISSVIKAQATPKTSNPRIQPMVTIDNETIIEDEHLNIQITLLRMTGRRYWKGRVFLGDISSEAVFSEVDVNGQFAIEAFISDTKKNRKLKPKMRIFATLARLELQRNYRHPLIPEITERRNAFVI